MSEEQAAAAAKSPLIQKIQALGKDHVEPYYKVDWAKGEADVGAKVKVFGLLEEAAKVLTPGWDADDQAVQYLKTAAPAFAALLPKKDAQAPQV